MFYLDHLRSLCSRAETPTSLVDGKSLDEHAHFVRHRLTEKGKLLWYQINSFLCYVMTHKDRGSTVVLSISKSVEPNEEQKEMISGFQQGILCKY